LIGNLYAAKLKAARATSSGTELISNKIVPGFTQKYNVTKLVYFEEFTNIGYAISREKQIKKWHRRSKNKLIESLNPEWKELCL